MGPKDRGTCVDAGALSQRTKGTMGMKRLLMHTAHPILREQLVNCKLTHISPCSHIFCILLLALELISASVLFYACPYAWPRLLNQEREWVSIHQMTLENNQIEGLTLFPLSSSHQLSLTSQYQKNELATAWAFSIPHLQRQRALALLTTRKKFHTTTFGLLNETNSSPHSPKASWFCTKGSFSIQYVFLQQNYLNCCQN